MEDRVTAAQAAQEVMAHLDMLAWEATPIDDPYSDWYFTTMHIAEHWWAACKYGTAYDWGN